MCWLIIQSTNIHNFSLFLAQLINFSVNWPFKQNCCVFTRLHILQPEGAELVVINLLTAWNENIDAPPPLLFLSFSVGIAVMSSGLGVLWMKTSWRGHSCLVWARNSSQTSFVFVHTLQTMAAGQPGQDYVSTFYSAQRAEFLNWVYSHMWSCKRRLILFYILNQFKGLVDEWSGNRWLIYVSLLF